ncbi:hypothetical protein ABT317_31050, partial [Streptomyces carpinensis]
GMPDGTAAEGVLPEDVLLEGVLLTEGPLEGVLLKVRTPDGGPATGTPRNATRTPEGPGQADTAPTDVVLLPSPPSARAAASGREAGEPPLSPGAFPGGPYCVGPLCGVPLYGGGYVPIPVLDRRGAAVGTRVRS